MTLKLDKYLFMTAIPNFTHQKFLLTWEYQFDKNFLSKHNNYTWLICASTSNYILKVWVKVGIHECFVEVFKQVLSTVYYNQQYIIIDEI